jgi:DNA-binding NtrC family response regulator
MMTKTILVVDEDPAVGAVIANVFGHKGMTYHFAPCMKDAMLILTSHGHALDLVISELEPRGHALALLAAIKTYRNDLPMIVLGSLANLRTNAKALRRGDCEPMEMPIDFMRLRTSMAGISATERAILA